MSSGHPLLTQMAEPCLVDPNIVNKLPTLNLQAEVEALGQAHPPCPPNPPDLRVWGTFDGTGDLGVLSFHKRHCPDLVHKPWGDCEARGWEEKGRDTERNREERNGEKQRQVKRYTER